MLASALWIVQHLRRHEHRVERTNAFVSLVLGYSVVGILFQSNDGYNLDAFWTRPF